MQHSMSLFACAILLMGCQTTGTSGVKTGAVSNAMPVVEQRPVAVGDTFVYRMADGTDLTSKVTAVTADRITSERSDGCSWESIRNAFAPNPSWKNCNGSSGSQTAQRQGGSMFPLNLNSVETWDFSGNNNNGNSWESTRNCRVMGEVSITVPAGTFDTYHVRCEDKWWTRDSYIRADGRSVRWSRTRKIGSADQNRSGDLVSYVPGAST